MSKFIPKGRKAYSPQDRAKFKITVANMIATANSTKAGVAKILEAKVWLRKHNIKYTQLTHPKKVETKWLD